MGRRDEGKLPSQPETNPKGQYGTSSKNHIHYHEQVQAITTLRSGREVDNQVEYYRDEELGRSHDKSRDHVSNTSKGESFLPNISESIPAASYKPKAPYPDALNDHFPPGKKKKAVEDMFETFRKVKINLPLLDAIKQVPAYAKFLKDLCTQKRQAKVHVSRPGFLSPVSEGISLS